MYVNKMIMLFSLNLPNPVKLIVWVHAKSLLLCLTLWDPMDYSLPDSSVHGDSPGKNTEVSWHALLQELFPTQGSNPSLLHLLHWQVGSLLVLPPWKLYKPINIQSKRGKLTGI